MDSLSCRAEKPRIERMNDRRRAARTALAAMDLTRLEDDADDAEVRALCRRADTPFGHPAAVCVYPAFIAAAREELADAGLSEAVAVATVANFPGGAAEPERAAAEVLQSVSLGADEVDVVFPWRALLDGDDTVGERLVRQCRAAAGARVLKVIVESGMLEAPEAIRRAANIAIDAGADFIKTSTGKTDVGATMQAADVMLEAIRDGGRPCGFKVSGGVRTLDDAAGYLQRTEQVLGAEATRPERFRIGASGLLARVLEALRAD
jgi:deoxyribose-phosphate aldolase